MFDEPETGPFEVPSRLTKTHPKPLPDDHTLYVLHSNKSACVFCSFSSVFYFLGDKTAADSLKYEISSSLKENGRLKISQYVALNHVREKRNHDANSHIKYRKKNMDMIHCLAFNLIQHESS